MEELIKSIQDSFSALSGNFLEKLAAQAQAIKEHVAPVIEKEFKDEGLAETMSGSLIDKIEEYAKSLVPAEGLTFDELLDLITNITDADKLKAKFFDGAKNSLTKAATKTAAEILKGGLDEN